MTKTDIRNACELFLEGWNRHDWMSKNGEWASESWNEEREAYNDAKEALAEALQDAVKAVQKCDAGDEAPDVFSEIEEAREALEAAAKALDGQVRADDSDYIAEGTIDPDDVANVAEGLDVGSSWQGWDCTEGWYAHRSGTALYVRWWRDAHRSRHNRDLWVCVNESFFEEESEDAA